MSILLTAPESASAGSMIPLILMYVVVFGVFFYFVLYRPQKKEQKKTSAMLSTLEIGDCVLTTSGFYGIIIDTIAGSEQIVPAQAIVNTLSFPSLSLQLTSTAGTGYNILPGFHDCFPIVLTPFTKIGRNLRFFLPYGQASCLLYYSDNLIFSQLLNSICCV